MVQWIQPRSLKLFGLVIVSALAFFTYDAIRDNILVAGTCGASDCAADVVHTEYSAPGRDYAFRVPRADYSANGGTLPRPTENTLHTVCAGYRNPSDFTNRAAYDGRFFGNRTADNKVAFLHAPTTNPVSNYWACSDQAYAPLDYYSNQNQDLTSGRFLRQGDTTTPSGGWGSNGSYPTAGWVSTIADPDNAPGHNLNSYSELDPAQAVTCNGCGNVGGGGDTLLIHNKFQLQKPIFGACYKASDGTSNMQGKLAQWCIKKAELWYRGSFWASAWLDGYAMSPFPCSVGQSPSGCFAQPLTTGGPTLESGWGQRFIDKNTNSYMNRSDLPAWVLASQELASPGRNHVLALQATSALYSDLTQNHPAVRYKLVITYHQVSCAEAGAGGAPPVWRWRTLGRVVTAASA